VANVIFMSIRRRIVAGFVLLTFFAGTVAPVWAFQYPLPSERHVYPVQSAAVPSASGETVRTTLQTLAIVVAVTAFLTREALEARRRKTSRHRKLAAIKTALARACELNNWTIKSLRRQLLSIPAHDHEAWDDMPATQYLVSFRQDGGVVLACKENGEIRSSGPLLAASIDGLRSSWLDVAELDPKLLPALDNAITGLEEINHVRSSLISLLLDEDERPEHLPPFISYARRQLEDAFDALETLYHECTGRNLTEHRVR
jgi:hypothetical protein